MDHRARGHVDKISGRACEREAGRLIKDPYGFHCCGHAADADGESGPFVAHATH